MWCGKLGLCSRCGWVHTHADTQVRGRFLPEPLGYGATYEGAPLRDTREQASADMCQYRRAASIGPEPEVSPMGRTTLPVYTLSPDSPDKPTLQVGDILDQLTSLYVIEKLVWDPITCRWSLHVDWPAEGTCSDVAIIRGEDLLRTPTDVLVGPGRYVLELLDYAIYRRDLPPSLADDDHHD